MGVNGGIAATRDLVFLIGVFQVNHHLLYQQWEEINSQWQLWLLLQEAM